MPETVALIVAAGRGSRMPGDIPKQYRHLQGRAILRHVLEAFVAHPGISEVRAVIHPDDAELFADASRGMDLGALVLGGILPLPEIAGYILVALGVAEIFILPIVLAKRWRSGQ